MKRANRKIAVDAAMGKRLGEKSRIRTTVIRTLGVCIALYGCYAFVKRGAGDYLFLRTAFAFFDHAEPVILFILDYMAITGTFVFLGYYLAQGLMRIDKTILQGGAYELQKTWKNKSDGQ